LTVAFRTEYIEEPDLMFGGHKEEKDPRIGLRYHGPYFYSTEQIPLSQVRIGIVGTGATIDIAKQVIGKLKTPVNSTEPNKWLYPDYPGFTMASMIKCDFITSPNWEAPIKEHEVKMVIEIADSVNRRIASAANLFAEKVHTISLEDNKPDVVLCLLPFVIEEYCGISERTRGAKRPKFTQVERLRAAFKAQGQKLLDEFGADMAEGGQTVDDTGLDLHNALKGKVMRFGIPVQVLRESSALGFLHWGEPSVKLTQEPATFAWNLATAIYYKANGKPWRLAKLSTDTCYVGVSFFRDLRNPDPNMRTSMAQVFTTNGEGIVLRGDDVVIDEVYREPHMSLRQSSQLMQEALRVYRAKSNREPTRVAIHKTTLFSQDEEAGFNEAVGPLARDFVTISPRHRFRFVRVGQYPVLRGTVIYLADNKCLLYTTGYTPRLRTYPGAHIPQPLLVTHHGDSEISRVCREIMGLTKLNWNSTAFATYLPITLEFSQKVGKVLSELPEERPLQDHYRFYM
jgi:hypothetical protein